MNKGLVTYLLHLNCVADDSIYAHTYNFTGIVVKGTILCYNKVVTDYWPDLIVLALGLPDADSMHLLDLVRKNSLAPIIALSACADNKDKVTALDKGANDYVIIKETGRFWDLRMQHLSCEGM